MILNCINCKTINDEIMALEKIIKDNKIVLIEKNEEPNLPLTLVPQIHKKHLKTIGDESIQIDYNYYVDKPSEEIRKKMEEKDISPELRRILMKILLNRIRKK